MPSLLASRRAVAEVSLHRTSVRKKGARAGVAQASSPPISWPVMALVGAAATAAASWILCAGVAVLGWLGTAPASPGGALQSGTLFWLLRNRAGGRGAP